jgi:cell division protein ZapA
MKQVEVSILGQVYVLACPDGGEASLMAAVATVDREMTAIRESGKVRARERMAVLAALNLAYRLAERGEPAPAAPVEGSSGDAIDVESLVRRIDALLGQDGHLI